MSPEGEYFNTCIAFFWDSLFSILYFSFKFIASYMYKLPLSHPMANSRQSGEQSIVFDFSSKTLFNINFLVLISHTANNLSSPTVKKIFFFGWEQSPQSSPSKCPLNKIFGLFPSNSIISPPLVPTKIFPVSFSHTLLIR